MKTCTKCKITYNNPEQHFKKDPSKKDGLYSSCKKCNHKDWVNNYPNIAETHRLKSNKYLSEHREERKEYLREWYLDNREYIADKGKSYRLANPEKIKIARKEHKHKRRAMLLDIENTLTKRDIEKQYSNQRGKCFYCGKKVGLDYHIDHIQPISRGGNNTPENIVIACPFCNMSKGYKTIDQFAGLLL